MYHSSSKPDDAAPLHWIQQLAEHDAEQLQLPALEPASDETVRWGQRTFARSRLPPSMAHDVQHRQPAASLDACHARAAGASGVSFHHRTGECTVFVLDSDLQARHRKKERHGTSGAEQRP